MKDFHTWLTETHPVDEGIFRNAVTAAALAAGGMGCSGGKCTPQQNIQQSAAQSGFTDNVSNVVQQRTDLALGFSIKQINPNTVRITYDSTRLNDEKAMERAMKRLSGGFEQWQPGASSQMQGSNQKTLDLVKR